MTVNSNVQFSLKARDEASSAFRLLQERVEGVNRSFEMMKKVAEAALIGISVARAWEGFRSVNEQIDQMGKSAQKIGMPVAQLSKLAYAANLADVPLEALQTSLGKFDKSLSEAAATGKGNVAEAFKVMGLSIRDANGHMKDQTELLGAVADKFRSYKDSADKTAISMLLFGKSGADMIPVLNQGSAAIASAGRELQQFGGVINESAVAAAETLNDDLKRLETAFHSVWQRVAVLVTPAIDKLVRSIVDFLGKSGNAKRAADAIAAALVKMAEIATQIYFAFDKFGATASYWFERLNNGFDASKWEAYKKQIADINGEQAKAIQLINEYAKSVGDVTDRDHLAGGLPGGEGGKGNAPHVAAGGMARIKKDPNLAEAKRIYDETRTAAEKYQIQLAKLNDLRDRGYIKQDTYNRAVKAAAEEYLKALDAQNQFDDGLQKTNQYLDTLNSAFSNWINDAVDGVFNLDSALGDLLKSFEKIALNAVFQQLMYGNGDGHPLYGGGGGGGLAGLITTFVKGFAGMFANGGRIGSGQWGIAGEAGAEIIAGPATVIPSHALGGGAPEVHINNYGAADGAQVSNVRQRGNRIELDVIMTRKVNETIASGAADSALGLRTGLQPARTRRG